MNLKLKWKSWPKGLGRSGPSTSQLSNSDLKDDPVDEVLDGPEEVLEEGPEEVLEKGPKEVLEEGPEEVLGKSEDYGVQEFPAAEKRADQIMSKRLSAVQKQLSNGFTISQALRHRRKDSNGVARSVFKMVLSRKGFKRAVSQQCRVSRSHVRRLAAFPKDSSPELPRNYRQYSQEQLDQIKEFLQRSDNSRQNSNWKQTRKFEGVLVARRVYLDYLNYLHKKFNGEPGGFVVGKKILYQEANKLTFIHRPTLTGDNVCDRIMKIRN